MPLVEEALKQRLVLAGQTLENLIRMNILDAMNRPSVIVNIFFPFGTETSVKNVTIL